jgi:hypothetical protein
MISNYPRTIKVGQIAANGTANSGVGLMMYDSSTSTYIAATPSTFTASTSTNGGILIDTFFTQINTTLPVALTAAVCKYVTLINLSANTASMTYAVGGTNLTLEKGYSVRVNTLQASNISIKQTGGEAEVMQYIVTT